MSEKYPKAFRVYLGRARFHVRGLFYHDWNNKKTQIEKDQEQQIMRWFYNCWRAGRKYERGRKCLK